MNNKKNATVVTFPQKKPIEQALENLTDVWNAERFANKYAGELMYVAQRGQWFQFDGNAWRPDLLRHVFQHAILLTRDMLLDAAKLLIDASQMRSSSAAVEAVKLAKHAERSQAKLKLEALLKIAETYPEIAVSQTQLDANDYLFGVQNGVIELNTGVFRAGAPEDFITRQSRTEWLGGDEDVGCPMFQAFLEHVQPDPDVRHWLQKLVGYCLSGNTDEQIFTIFQGGGSNGKGVFIEMVKRILGEYADVIQFDSLIEKDKSAIRNDLAALVNVRLVVASEGPNGARLDEGIIKQVTGQDEVKARFLYKEEFRFKPKLKMILVVNPKPVISGTDNGIWRRVVLVPWSITIPRAEADLGLADKLASELPGILAWAVKGYHLWREQGLSDLPPSILAATQEYRKDSDIVGLWVDEMCNIAQHLKCQSTLLYTNYKNWALDSGFRPLSQRSLSDQLKAKGFDCRKSGTKFWYGITLKL